MAQPNLAPSKFQERLSGASRMQENLLAVGVLLRTSLQTDNHAITPPLSLLQASSVKAPKALMVVIGGLTVTN